MEMYDIINYLNYTENAGTAIKMLQKEIKERQAQLTSNGEDIKKYQFLPIKRTFGQILFEIARQNDINTNSIFIRFMEKTCGGYFFKIYDTKIEAIKKELEVGGDFSIRFSIASDIKCLEEDSSFFTCIFPLKEVEKKVVKKKRKNDPLYGEYEFNARPFEIQNNSKKLYNFLKMKPGVCMEEAWIFTVNKRWSPIYCHIDPKYINLDSSDAFSKAVKNLLTDEELYEYYKAKNRYDLLYSERETLYDEIDSLKKMISTLKNSKTKDVRFNTDPLFNEDIARLEKITKEEAFAKIRKDCHSFKKLVPKFKGDKQIALEAVVMDGMLLKYTSEELKNDEEVVKAAINSNSMSLEFTSNRIKDNETLVMNAVSRCGLSLEFASPNMKRNYDIVLEAVKNNGLALAFAHITDENIVLEAVRQNGLSLKYAKGYQDNRQIVLEAIKQNGLAIKYADKKYLSDKEIMLEVVSQKPSCYLVAFAPESLRNSRDFMTKACEIDSSLIKYATPELRDLLRIDMIYNFVDDYLKNDLSHAKQKVKVR